MSEMLEKARKYEDEQGKQIKAEDRPAFHVSPYVGWMNDPNGFSYYQGEYHLFYQYYPYDTHWNSMHWGHVVSKDLLHWEYLPAALAPDEEYDKIGCFSGSAAELPDGQQLLIYTSVDHETLEDGTVRDIQTQSVAVGDGTDYKKYEKNPVLTGQDVPACGFSIGFERIILLLMESGFKVPGAPERTAYLLEKGLPSDRLCEVIAEAQEERKNGKQILVVRMNKNKKFQKEQLARDGYTEIKEFYKNPIQ